MRKQSSGKGFEKILQNITDRIILYLFLVKELCIFAERYFDMPVIIKEIIQAKGTDRHHSCVDRKLRGVE